MIYVNCLRCGGRLLEGEEGSHVVIKCVKCNGLFEVVIKKEQIEISLRQKTQKEIPKE